MNAQRKKRHVRWSHHWDGLYFPEGAWIDEDRNMIWLWAPQFGLWVYL